MRKNHPKNVTSAKSKHDNVTLITSVMNTLKQFDSKLDKLSENVRWQSATLTELRSMVNGSRAVRYGSPGRATIGTQCSRRVESLNRNTRRQQPVPTPPPSPDKIAAKGIALLKPNNKAMKSLLVPPPSPHSPVKKPTQCPPAAKHVRPVPVTVSVTKLKRRNPLLARKNKERNKKLNVMSSL